MSPQIVIKKVVYGGDGLGEHEGKVVFVPDVLEGETVEIEILQDKKNFAKAKAIKILTASDKRIDSPCPYTSDCGGCQYLHTTYKEELRMKAAQVQEFVTHHLKLEASLVSPIVPSPKEFRYRSSVTLRPMGNSGTSRLAYVARDNHSSVVVDDCLLADENLKSAFSQVVEVPEEPTRFVFKLDSDGKMIPGHAKGFYKTEILGQDFWASSGGFFQNNLGVTEKIIAKVRSEVQLAKPDVFFDLYAGTGLFGILATDPDTEKVFVEDSKAGFEAIKKNAIERKHMKSEAYNGKSEEAFPKIFGKRYANKKVAVFVDPPRQGLHPKLVEFLVKEPVRTLFYLSCDLATLTRDLKTLTQSGKYKLKNLTPFDMFPKTKHIECLATLEFLG